MKDVEEKLKERVITTVETLAKKHAKVDLRKVLEESQEIYTTEILPLTKRQKKDGRDSLTADEKRKLSNSIRKKNLLRDKVRDGCR
jgi:hypothetical protein